MEEDLIFDEQTISIHALLAESDLWVLMGGSNCDDFYPRSPCGERRPQPPKARVLKNFYPRSPCGERQAQKNSECPCLPISIHALLAESDLWNAPEMPTQEISIHALLAESDSQQPRGTTRTTYFYPRSPCGERRGNCP